MLQGTVLRPSKKGFMFIRMDGDGDEVFCHASDLVDVEFSDLVGGERVSVERIDKAPKGRRCVGVRVLE